MNMQHYDLVVIGSGVSGLVTARHALKEGLSVLVLERAPRIGGIWDFDAERAGGVMKSTRINISKFNYAFSEFPFSEDAPDFPDNRAVLDYIRGYARHFGLDQVIRCGMTVTETERLSDECWLVTAVTGDGHIECWTTGHLSIATGHHTIPRMPEIPGLDGFTGQVHHSAAYKGHQFIAAKDQSVLIVGLGNTAVDVACDIVTEAKDITISSRSGAWIVPNFVFGYPTDLYATRLVMWLPWKWSSAGYEAAIRMLAGSPERWGAPPQQGALRSHPTVGGRLIALLQNRQVKLAGGIESIDGNQVTLTTGEEITPDIILLCTGYRIEFPFLPEEINSAILRDGASEVDLFMNMFAPGIGKSLSFIGLVQSASGGLIPVSEMQARWLMRLIRNKIKLPGQDEMRQRIVADRKAVQVRYVRTERHTIQRDPIPYNDEIAGWLGLPILRGHDVRTKFRLFFGTGGIEQWTEARTDTDRKRIRAAIRAVPIPPAMWAMGFMIIGLLVLGGLAALALLITLLRSLSG